MRKYFIVPIVLMLAVGFIAAPLIQTAFAAEKDKYGGILRFNISKSVVNIGDPMTAMGAHYLFNCYVLQGLVELSNEKMGEVIPELATSWELAPDKSHYIFHLRKGVKFHDGTEFNAKAAKWNLDRVIKSKRPQLANVESIDVIDNYTIRANLKKWDLTVIHGFRGKVISPTSFEKHGQKWVTAHPIGTGPFKLKEFRRDIHIKYEKFNDYWEKGLPYLDGIHITMVKDPMTTLAMMKRGDIDAWAVVDVSSSQELLKSGNFGHSISIGPDEVLSFDSKDPKSPWSDKRMRMALEYALDKEAICDAVGFGFKPPVYNIIKSIPPHPGIVPRKYNPEKARQLIKEAGYSQGLSVKLFVANFLDLMTLGTAMQGYFKEVGIDVELVPLAMPPLFGKIFGNTLKGSEMVIGPVQGNPADVFTYALENFGPGALPFRTIKKPEGYEVLLDKAVTSDSRSEGIKYLQQLDKLLYDDCMVVALRSNQDPDIFYPYVKDIVMTWGNSYNPKLKWTWLDKEK